MERLACAGMGKKEKYIRVRADDELKAALAQAAARDVRSEADEARYLLMKGLGLLAVAEEQPPYQTRGEPTQKKVGGH